MPKGFLVKRSKRTGAFSYRIRDDSEPAQTLPSVADVLTFPLFRDDVQASNFAQRTPPTRVYFGGMPESFYAPSLSPTRPDSSEYNNQCPADTEPLRSTVSPSLTEIFPEPILGSFAVNGSPATPSLPEMTSKLDSICKEQARAAAKRPAPTSAKNQASAKKRKSTGSPNQEKRPVCRDEVTTSPVLGLRIKEDPDEDTRKSSNTGSPLGGFVCQLCKESYPDPLGLAHHKCSRIVRVEYRCTECDKVFSCPANLASHRRWHKPRNAQGESVSPQQEENKSSPTASSQGMSPRDIATPPPHSSDSASDDEMLFNCPLCAKKFRRQAYLRKHLALHSRKASGLLQNQFSQDVTVTTKSPCGKAEERVAPDAPVQNPTNDQMSVREGDVYNCRFCGDNFFSSPGLTRHINKYHPTENRQVIFLSRTV